MIARRLKLTIVMATVVCAQFLPTASANGPPLGETTVFARVPYPGQPWGIVVDGDTVWTTSGAFMELEVEEWPVWAYDLDTGREKTDDSMRIRRRGPAFMALAGMAQDAQGRLYAVDMNGRILRTTDARLPAGGRLWEVYATIPNHGHGTTHHTPWPAGTMPTDIAFDAAGNAYIADLNFAGIWRVPPGGGEAKLWFLDPRLQGYPDGVASLRLGPTGRDLFFTHCASGHAQSAGHGVIYRLPTDQPTAEQLTEVHRVTGAWCPFGLAFGASGKLYVTGAQIFLPPAAADLVSNQILVLNPDGTEALRFPSPAANARRGLAASPAER
jgi:streptogramin lyase